ncbi:hypothetical protein BHM03_00000199 [Ensete ventricosum]|nr:hypothetical protein BHM03_00000199 [Ensete ventricosum]
MYHDLFVCILQCSQDDNVWIGSKPRDPGHGLFKNVITASEQNKVDGVIAAPQGTTERLTAREPVLPGVASSTSIPHSRSQAGVEGASELFPKLCGGIDHLLASKLYELHICTKGSTAYATEMAKLLDPTGSLFPGRVISRGDDGDASPSNAVERASKPKDLDGVLGLESAVLIVDDSPEMWPRYQPNLIVVERYQQLVLTKIRISNRVPVEL